MNSTTHPSGAAVLEREVSDRLLDRLDIMRIQPKIILNIGAKTDYLAQCLTQRYPDADIIALGSAENLSKTADFIVANLIFSGSESLKSRLEEWRRFLKPGGLLLFSIAGPDTLYELRESFAAVDQGRQPRLPIFMEMHNIGDLLIAAHFAEPVMQTEHLYFTYSTLANLFQDLKSARSKDAPKTQCRGLQGKNSWQKMLTHYRNFMTPEQEFPVTVELITGLGWVAEQPVNHKDEHGNITIPIHSIKRSSDR